MCRGFQFGVDDRWGARDENGRGFVDAEWQGIVRAIYAELHRQPTSAAPASAPLMGFSVARYGTGRRARPPEPGAA